jgi:hypothetical protein
MTTDGTVKTLDNVPPMNVTQKPAVAAGKSSRRTGHRHWPPVGEEAPRRAQAVAAGKSSRRSRRPSHGRGPDAPRPATTETAGIPAVSVRASCGGLGQQCARYQRRPASSTIAELPIAASATRIRNVASRRLRFMITTAPQRSGPVRDDTRRRDEHEARQDRLHVPFPLMPRAPGNRAFFRRRKIPGFASPPRGGFAPDESRTANLTAGLDATQHMGAQQWATSTSWAGPSSDGSTRLPASAREPHVPDHG